MQHMVALLVRIFLRQIAHVFNSIIAHEPFPFTDDTESFNYLMRDLRLGLDGLEQETGKKYGLTGKLFGLCHFNRA